MPRPTSPTGGRVRFLPRSGAGIVEAKSLDTCDCFSQRVSSGCIIDLELILKVWIPDLENEVFVGSYGALQEVLFEDSWDKKIGRHRASFAFRGVSDAGWTMPSSLQRLSGPYRDLERHLLRNFKKYALRNVVERDNFWHWLTVGQHHGLPTRLLDWTFSPLVGLHFATANSDHREKDGAVWKVDINEVHQKLPDELKGVLRDEGSFVFSIEMLEHQSESSFETNKINNDRIEVNVVPGKKIDSLTSFDQFSNDPFCVFFEPPSLDDRVVNQYALFSVISDPELEFDDWLVKRSVRYKKIVIPAGLKQEIRDKLDQQNVTERVLFPGLDGLSTWLKRHYGPSK
ncbi:MAG: FRG domain-containing protein [Shimia sp.]